MEKELLSKNLGIPYVILKREEGRLFVCKSGVLFSEKEYKETFVSPEELKAEHDRRLKEEQLYDYVYAKSSGILRKKRNAPVNVAPKEQCKKVASEADNKEAQEKTVEVVEKEQRQISDRLSNREDVDRRAGNKSVLVICILLAFTSAISMYISTLHTATYLTDYADLISAWLMSASVTAYNATAFEVSVLFKSSKRHFMSVLFMFLWILVTLFSMATTVSVFYDSFNFNEYQITEENRESDTNRLALEMLQRKEEALREDIAYKKKDIDFRQEHDYATTAVRNELTKLQEELQENLSEQQKIMEATPDVVSEKAQRKESLFTFLGRLLHLEGGILEFIMSTLSAIFVNLIAPLSLTAVVELLKKKDLTN